MRATYLSKLRRQVRFCFRSSKTICMSQDSYVRPSRIGEKPCVYRFQLDFFMGRYPASISMPLSSAARSLVTLHDMNNRYWSARQPAGDLVNKDLS